MEKNGKKAVVIGMAKSGIASAKLLYELGYDVTVNDMKTDIKGLKEELSGIEYKDALGVDHAEAVKGADLVVLSPVVPIFSPFVDEARAAGAEVIGEIELGYRYCNRGHKVHLHKRHKRQNHHHRAYGRIIQGCRKAYLCAGQHRRAHNGACARN